MGRHRTPAKILELRGTFKQNPKRRRVDPVGSRPADLETPPARLPEQFHEAWHYIAQNLPEVDIYNSDEPMIELAARALYECWYAPDARTARLARAQMMQFFTALGMTPAARLKLAPSTQPKKLPTGNAPSGRPWTGNKFADC